MHEILSYGRSRRKTLSRYFVVLFIYFAVTMEIVTFGYFSNLSGHKSRPHTAVGVFARGGGTDLTCFHPSSRRVRIVDVRSTSDLLYPSRWYDEGSIVPPRVNASSTILSISSDQVHLGECDTVHAGLVRIIERFFAAEPANSRI